MKGMLYESFLLNRKWFLAAGIVAVIGTVATIILLALGLADFANIVLIFGEAITLGVVCEWVDRHLENNLKCRFVDVELAAGISKNMFVMFELMKNLITIALGFVMCIAMNGIIFAAEKIIGLETPFGDAFYIKLAVVVALFMGITNFISVPLTINLKSAEKAGMLIGLLFGFGIVMPLSMVYFSSNPDPDERIPVLEMIYKFFDEPYFFPVVIGAAAVIYAIFYVITLKRVKRGDVC